MENLAQALKELGEKNGFEIELDESGSCTLELADGRPILLQERTNLNELDFGAILGEVPEDVRADVFESLLTANFYWKETLGATLSWNVDIQQVVLIYPLPLADATATTLESVFTHFLELQAAWKDRLAGLVANAQKGEDEEEEEEAPPAANDNMIINP